jgi:hypothetical protein
MLLQAYQAAMAPEFLSRQSQEKADGVTPAGFFSAQFKSTANGHRLFAALAREGDPRLLCALVLARPHPKVAARDRSDTAS